MCFQFLTWHSYMPWSRLWTNFICNVHVFEPGVWSIANRSSFVYICAPDDNMCQSLRLIHDIWFCSGSRQQAAVFHHRPNANIPSIQNCTRKSIVCVHVCIVVERTGLSMPREFQIKMVGGARWSRKKKKKKHGKRGNKHEMETNIAYVGNRVKMYSIFQLYLSLLIYKYDVVCAFFLLLWASVLQMRCNVWERKLHFQQTFRANILCEVDVPWVHWINIRVTEFNSKKSNWKRSIWKYYAHIDVSGNRCSDTFIIGFKIVWLSNCVHISAASSFSAWRMIIIHS